MRFGWLLPLLVVGCTFSPGVSFGSLEGATLSAQFAPDTGRLDSEGWFKTSNDMRLRIDSLELQVKQINLEESSTSGSAGSFDPANPPPGYSLCHNGHCHRDDGALIDYEDIRAEQAGGSKSRITLSLPIDRALALSPGATVSLNQCSPDCTLERGRWTRAILSFNSLVATGSVKDPTAAGRLGSQTRDWTMTLSPPALGQKIDVPLDRGYGGSLRLDARFMLANELWDGLDWEAIAPATGTIPLSATPSKETLMENFAKSQLTLTTHR